MNELLQRIGDLVTDLDQLKEDHSGKVLQQKLINFTARSIGKTKKVLERVSRLDDEEERRATVAKAEEKKRNEERIKLNEKIKADAAKQAAIEKKKAAKKK